MSAIAALGNEMTRYNSKIVDGEAISIVAGYEVTYPARCNGHLGDIGFVCSTGYGSSDFVHFSESGQPYGFVPNERVAYRLKQMRRDFAHLAPTR